MTLRAHAWWIALLAFGATLTVGAQATPAAQAPLKFPELPLVCRLSARATIYRMPTPLA